eukprot:scaffold116262_cov66-Phaeocystis_antarctica.AAC.2
MYAWMYGPPLYTPLGPIHCLACAPTPTVLPRSHCAHTRHDPRRASRPSQDRGVRHTALYPTPRWRWHTPRPHGWRTPVQGVHPRRRMPRVAYVPVPRWRMPR